MDDANDTLLTHGGRNPQRYFGAVNTPVCRMSTVLFKDYAAWQEAESGKRHVDKEGHSYGRYGNPTTTALAAMVAELEGGTDTVLTSCGLSALTLALQTFLVPDTHALVADHVYGPTARWFTEFGAARGVEHTFFNARSSADELQSLLRPNTKVLFLESPGSFTFELSDVPALTDLARRHGIISIGDNTWGALLHFAPFARGLDVSVQSLTKYAGGHSDAMMGAVTCREPKLARQIRHTASLLGNMSASADDAALILRGLRTLSVRLARHESHALALAADLQTHKAVAAVLHPGLPSHPDHALWQRDFTGSCGLFGVLLHPLTPAQSATFVNALQHYGVGYSWGGYESLLLPAPLTGLNRTKALPAGSLFRIHVGLEDYNDLRDDLRQALDLIVG